MECLEAIEPDLSGIAGSRKGLELSVSFSSLLSVRLQLDFVNNAHLAQA